MTLDSELIIFAVSQLGLFVAAFAALRADVRNLTGWVKGLSPQVQANSTMLAEHKGIIETLPCARCTVK